MYSRFHEKVLINTMMIETPKSNPLRSFYLKFARTAFVDPDVLDDVEIIAGQPTVIIIISA